MLIVGWAIRVPGFWVIGKEKFTGSMWRSFPAALCRVVRTTIHGNPFCSNSHFCSDVLHHSQRKAGRRRPFKMVQKFLHAKPLAKHLSLCGFIITNASYIVIDKYVGLCLVISGCLFLFNFCDTASNAFKNVFFSCRLNVRQDDVVSFLSTMSSPLSASRHHLRYLVHFL